MNDFFMLKKNSFFFEILLKIFILTTCEYLLAISFTSLCISLMSILVYVYMPLLRLIDFKNYLNNTLVAIMCNWNADDTDQTNQH